MIIDSRPSRLRRRTFVRGVGAAGISVLLGVQLTACVAKTDGPTATARQTSTAGIPCDAKRVLETVCQKCHSDPPRNSAPFPLVTYEDTQVMNSGMPIWTYMLSAIQSDVMPLPPVSMSSTDRSTLVRWLTDGAPARTASDTCSSPMPDAGAFGASDAGLVDGPQEAAADDGGSASEAEVDALATCGTDDGATSCE